jgi:beta-aspartyl-peptidase (threonine type)
MPQPVIAIHGGAGTVARESLTPAVEAEYHDALEAALEAGWRVLEADGTAVDAVEQAVRALEDNPLFNAGRGAVFNAAGEIELDACVMDGATLEAGAVTNVRTVRNPVSLARAVMDHTGHVLLAGLGAEALARERGLELVPAAYFETDARREALQRVQAAGAARSDRDRHGTVGAVALDWAGNLAAATSTGGQTNKHVGRVGDTPIVGAGTYADARVAVSATGDGEMFMRTNAAYRISALVEYAGCTPIQAARRTLGMVKRLGGRGGMIIVDRKGTVCMPFNAEGMYRGLRRSNASVRTGIHRDDVQRRPGKARGDGAART